MECGVHGDDGRIVTKIVEVEDKLDVGVVITLLKVMEVKSALGIQPIPESATWGNAAKTYGKIKCVEIGKRRENVTKREKKGTGLGEIARRHAKNALQIFLVISLNLNTDEFSNVNWFS